MSDAHWRFMFRRQNSMVEEQQLGDLMGDILVASQGNRKKISIRETTSSVNEIVSTVPCPDPPIQAQLWSIP